MGTPWRHIVALGGADIRLVRRDDEYVMLANGRPLMSSRSHGSEEALATLGCGEVRRLTRPRVLVGGLGMGFTLRAVLDVLPSAAVVTVAELVPAVIQWNREPLAALAGHPLRDPRVGVEVADVGFTLRANCGRFDAILLDVDNGPSAFTVGANAGLYDNTGVAAAYAALCPRGTFAIWSAWEDTKFEQRLRAHGFAVQPVRVHARRKNKGGPRHTIFIAHKDASIADACGTRVRHRR